MRLRPACPDDAEPIAAIYAPFVRDTPVSFETEPPSAEEMRRRIADTLPRHPWLVGLDDRGRVSGYACAARFHERAAYRWSVSTSVYLREDCRRRGLGRALYTALFAELVKAGHCQAFALITLPNAGSVALHESVGFSSVGVCRDVGHKLGAWHDVGWWQKALQAPRNPPPSLSPFLP